ncbi:ABC transporter permease subunit, partial [Microbacteriaceae bacterium K1510]|nr:ABC transporter permease subunit [Microbacteriaceae bacterium K1510]
VGIPSVVYGYIGLTLLVPFLREHFEVLGFSLLAGGLVLALMILPTITSVATDAIEAVPQDIRNASLALGATRWQTIWNVVLHSALPGCLTAIVLGMARAFGEALAVQMVIGNTTKLPGGLLDPISTLT